MKKIILVNGLIAGVIASIMYMIDIPLMMNGTLDMNTSILVGYTSMVIALSVIFFGIKTYRDQYLGGSITFWGGLKIGLLITLIASLVYSISWEAYQVVAAPDFMEFYKKCYIDEVKSNGGGEQEVAAAIEEIDQMMTMYKNPVLRFLMTMSEILPVGVVISLIAAALLRKREVMAV